MIVSLAQFEIWLNINEYTVCGGSIAVIYIAQDTNMETH
jgi:hypothetical protein